MIIPNQIQIETVSGLCSVSCNMCPIDSHPRKEIMSFELFSSIFEKLIPYRKEIDMVSLCGIGETLLDKGIFQKIDFLKDSGFRGIAVYTNGIALTEKNILKLLETQLETIVISLDGITKDTQDVIRVGSKIDPLLKKINNLVKHRNESNSNTAIILRFTAQDINRDSFDSYNTYWSKRLDEKKMDKVLYYEIHNHGNLVNVSGITNRRPNSEIKYTCPELFKRLTIHSNGNVAMCCGDHFEKHNPGSAITHNPIDIYNSGLHEKFRLAMDAGMIDQLDICRTCDVIQSIESKKDYIS